MSEADFKKSYFETVFDSVVYDAVDTNKSVYQISYLSDVKNTLSQDLNGSKLIIGEPGLVQQLLDARKQQPNPSTNNRPSQLAQSEVSGSPIFDYEIYKNSLFILDNTTIDTVETGFENIKAYNASIGALQSQLLLTKDEQSVVSNRNIFRKNLV